MGEGSGSGLRGSTRALRALLTMTYAYARHPEQQPKAACRRTHGGARLPGPIIPGQSGTIRPLPGHPRPAAARFDPRCPGRGYNGRMKPLATPRKPCAARDRLRPPPRPAAPAAGRRAALTPASGGAAERAPALAGQAGRAGSAVGVAFPRVWLYEPPFTYPETLNQPLADARHGRPTRFRTVRTTDDLSFREPRD